MTATIEPRTRRLTVPQIRRLVQLSDANLSDAAVAIVMNLDHGLGLEGMHVKYYRFRYGSATRPHGFIGGSRGVVGLSKDNRNFAGHR